MIVSIILIVFCLLTVQVQPAQADVHGPACVIKGDTLMINGKRSFGTCRGGTTVRLFGVIAPDVDQTCEAPDGRKWQCGRASAAMVLETIKGKTLICKGYTKNAEGEILADCQLNGVDLNRHLVREGWVLAYPKHTVKYMMEEKEAAAARKGLWRGITWASLDWRNH